MALTPTLTLPPCSSVSPVVKKENKSADEGAQHLTLRDFESKRGNLQKSVQAASAYILPPCSSVSPVVKEENGYAGLTPPSCSRLISASTLAESSSISRSVSPLVETGVPTRISSGWHFTW